MKKWTEEDLEKRIKKFDKYINHREKIKGCYMLGTYRKKIRFPNKSFKVKIDIRNQTAEILGENKDLHLVYQLYWSLM